ncbi:hypothetical protein DWV22_01010 [Weissella confusa]|uniref:hypothetical protein n=1 Tax=Weissella confusa TaxID=1583 RepID=UPI000E511DF1|nr:hypothetical protein [Weissella confusa]RGX49941.1 hypothetical protein DWV22_01010 [Weissella confusa]
MAIVGVKPLNKVKTKFAHKMSGEALVVNGEAADEYYDREKVREIVIKFANSKNAMRRDMTVEQIVDEFMESDGE